jgi:putative transposase
MQENALNTSGHAAYALQVHIVFVTKYRHKCLTLTMLESMQRQISAVCEKWRCALIEFNGEEDHVHLLASIHPTVAVSDLVSNLKTVTARRMRSEFAQHLRPFYWKPVFWSSSYAAFSVGSTDLKTVTNYIRNQEAPSH